MLVIGQIVLSLVRRGFLIGILGFSVHAGASSSSTLKEFEISSCSDKVCFKAQGKKGDMSSFSLLIAGEDVSLTTKNSANGKISQSQCKDFSYEVNQNYLICRFANRGAMTLDISSGNSHFYNQ